MCCLEVNVAPRDTGTMRLRRVRRPMQQTSKLGKGFWEYLAIWRFSLSASWCLTIKETVLVVGAICLGPSTINIRRYTGAAVGLGWALGPPGHPKAMEMGPSGRKGGVTRDEALQIMLDWVMSYGVLGWRISTSWKY